MEQALSLISGKWKADLLLLLAQAPQSRYTELRKQLPGISHKVLAHQLRELEEDRLILRWEYFEIPSRVEYGLSPLGKSLLPILCQLEKWGEIFSRESGSSSVQNK